MRGHDGRGRTVRSDEGSAVVSALVVGLIVATVVTMLATRSLGESIASAAHIERARAAALAEYGTVAAVAQLDAGLALELRRSPGSDVLTLAVGLPEEGAVGPLDDASVEVSVSRDDLTGEIRIVSTAAVGSRTHTSSARVRSRSTVDHLLLRAYETVDPVPLRLPRSGCAVRRDDEARAADCIHVMLPAGLLDGPVHSNDVIGLSGSTTIGSMLSTSHLEVIAGSVAPALLAGSAADVLPSSPFGLHHRAEIVLPRTTATVARDTHITCRFRGPTLVRFDGSSVRVTSPRSTVRVDDPPDGGAAIGCLGVDRDLLVAPTTIDLPERAVIEIVRDDRGDCSVHPLGLAVDEDSARDWWCSDGDAFVWGTYSGARTILAQDNIQLVWDVVPHVTAPVSGTGVDGERASGDVLGLVAGDSIVLRRLVGPSSRRGRPNVAFAGPGIPPFGDYPLDAPTTTATTWDAPTIVAGLVALRGSVGIQNPTIGQLHSGPVTIEGSVASRFAGLFRWEDRTDTGTLRGESGYDLVLRYDPTLIGAAPPGMPVTDGGAVRILSLARTG